MSTCEPEAVPCYYCGTPTINDSTHLCDDCWELERRIEGSPEIALRILEKIGAVKSNA